MARRGLWLLPLYGVLLAVSTLSQQPPLDLLLEPRVFGCRRAPGGTGEGDRDRSRQRGAERARKN